MLWPAGHRYRAAVENPDSPDPFPHSYAHGWGHAGWCSLSVSKWIHINWGDKGLRQLFDKVFRVLAPVRMLPLRAVVPLEFRPWSGPRSGATIVSWDGWGGNAEFKRGITL